MIKKFVFLLLLVSSPFLFGEDYGSVRAVYRGLYDGDTIYVDIPGYPPIVGNNVAIRLAGIDTPEIRGGCDREKELAQEAKRYVDSIIRGGNDLILRRLDRGKYFRIVAEVWVDNKNVGELLIQADLAVRYDGSKKVYDWCAGN